MRYVILGTAGHIDHGKSSLVKALTGIDPDRLKEEKERGITIDLGFADMEYPDGLTIGIVDVPGHERLVRNMLAGAGGIDILMLVIAGDEGIMPQSREHLNICSLLKIKTGIIAITKADLVEPEWLELVKDDVRGFVKGTFLESSPIIPVSSKTGFNLDLLKEEIRNTAMTVKQKPTGGLFRLPIDRVFTLKGFGTVVTGTAVTGSVLVEDTVEILPKNMTCKIRGLHSHGKAIEKAYAGQRVAVNLQGVEKEDLQRGDTIVSTGRFTPTSAIDVKLELLRDAPKIKNREKFHFYTGTSETIARGILYDKEELAPGEGCFAQMRLSDPVVVQAGDRYIIRRFSPVETIGGGEIIDSHPSKRKKGDGLEDLIIYEQSGLIEKIEFKIKKTALKGMSGTAIEGWLKAEVLEIKDAVRTLKSKGTLIHIDDTLIHKSAGDDFRKEVISRLERFHKENPLKEGFPKEELRTSMRVEPRVFSSLISKVEETVLDRELLRLKSFKVAMSEEEKTKILDLIEKGGIEPPSKSELAASISMDEKRVADILKILQKENSIVRINDSINLGRAVYDAMMEKLKGFFSHKSEMSVAEFRDMLGTSRKYAVPYLEHLDSSRITMRVGDVRKLLLKTKTT